MTASSPAASVLVFMAEVGKNKGVGEAAVKKKKKKKKKRDAAVVKPDETAARGDI